MVRHTSNTEINGRKSLAAGRRAGLTVLEFLGCVIAVIGGAWLGAIYLGVDVRHLAHTALAEAALLDKIPSAWQPPGPEETITREQLVSTLREEFGSLRTEITSLRASGEGEGDADTAQDAKSSKASATRSAFHDHTLAYWVRLNDIALGETALQHDAESAFDAANAAKVFAIKARISRFAANAVDVIPNESVDSAVAQFGRQLARWYDAAGDLYDRATQIWESPTSKEGRSHLNDAWSRAELQHRNEARLLSDRADAVRAAISRRFHEEFPAFAKPGDAASSQKPQATAP